MKSVEPTLHIAENSVHRGKSAVLRFGAPCTHGHVTEICATIVVESAWERCLSLLHHHHSLQRQKPAHTGCKHTAKVNFSNPALCSETVQNSTVLEICLPASKPASRCAKCLQTEEKNILAPKTYQVSWITRWLCYSLSKQTMYSCCA